MKSELIFDDGHHSWVFFGRDPLKDNDVIDTNQYLIISKNQGMLLDPGGIAIFPQFLTELTKYVATKDIKLLLASHQDPDIASSLSLWIDLCPEIKVYCSWIWTGFLAHFGMGTSLTLNPVPDNGMELEIGNSNSFVYLVPAHYCHSSGNLSLFDPRANILFSGDIGAALLPNQESGIFVNDFNSHIKYMEAFHKRWMPSKDALKKWVRRVRAINPSMIVPQHGTIFKDENVHKFLDWLESLEVASYDTSIEDTNINKTIWMKWKNK